jgi:hypothetical protein
VRIARSILWTAFGLISRIGVATMASAAPFTVTATGQLTAVSDSSSVSDGSLAINVPYTAVMTYDTDAATDREPDLASFGDFVVPPSASSFLVTVGNYSFDASGILVLELRDGYYDPNEDAIGWFIDGFASSGVLAPGVSWGSFGYATTILFDHTGTALSSDLLASANWNRSAYAPDNSAFYLLIEVLDPSTAARDSIELKGTIASLVVSAPEPSASALFGAAAVAMAALRRRRA